jgi:integrase
VRWRDERGRNRSKVLGRKRDAEAFDAEVRRMKRTRELGRLDAGKQTLAQFGEEWWELHAQPNLARKTQELYAMLWDLHILPRLGGLALRDLTPETIQGFRVELEAAGTGPVSLRKALTLLHGVLQRGVEWGRIPFNPAAAVRKPKAVRKRSVRPLAPATVEQIRCHLLERDRFRDATLVSVLAYAGLRPGEALALPWGCVRERTLLVESAVSLGQIGATKTGQTRTVRLLAPLAQDVAEWRLRCGRPADPALVIPLPAEARGRGTTTRTGALGSTGRRPGHTASSGRVPTTCATRSSRS